MYVCIYVCMYVCMYVYIYIYIYTPIDPRRAEAVMGFWIVGRQ